MSNCFDDLIPEIGVISHIKQETLDTKTFFVVDENGKKPFVHEPGQCAMLGVPGVGEAMFSISSSPSDTGYLEFTIKSLGKLTNFMHKLEVGSKLTIRGPYGKSFPVSGALKKRDLLFIAGGIGIAPLRSVIRYVFDNREDYGAVDIVYGARSSADLLFMDEIRTKWTEVANSRISLTIDNVETGWDGHVGFVPSYLTDIGFAPNKTALVCGPPVMIKYSLEALLEMDFIKQQVYTTLEMRMKCGIGKCGRCNIGPKYICKDGPVFRCDELEYLPDEY